MCQLVWAGDARVKPRSQASVAVSVDGRRWTLLNASPDLRAQVQATPALQPRSVPRDSPIDAVILTGAEVDQTAGLLTLRERQAFTLFATGETLAALDANPIFGVLSADVVERRKLALEQPFELPGGLQARLFAVPGKAALYLEGDSSVGGAGVNVGVALVWGAQQLLYVPGAAALPATLRTRLAEADV